MNIVDRTIKDIKSLKIQGASKVKEKAIIALVEASLHSKANDVGDFRKEFLVNSKKLFNARPTEPALRNTIRVFKKSIAKKDLNIAEMKKIIYKTSRNYEIERKRNNEKRTKFGAEVIKRNAVIMTLCHSHAVVDVLIKAKRKIKHVYCCETRPLFQGRITAKELASAGIKVTLIVDNAASIFLKECDYFFTGADAFLADGDVINKIGTNQISTLCRRYETKHYVVTSTNKFEPASFFGKDEPIEQRDEKEVLQSKIPRVNVVNPAFDRTNSSLIEGIICEKGVFPPQVLASKLYTELELDKKEIDFLKL